jgi:branched-chain amino acid transport system substrate-binding protein
MGIRFGEEGKVMLATCTMKRVLLLPVLIVLVACGGGSPVGGSTPGAGLGTIKIGALEPLSGSTASSGQDTLHGIEVATEVLNGKLSVPGLPGLSDGKIQLLTEDTQGNPQTATAAVDRLVQTEKVAALIGAFQSSVTLVAAQRADRLGIPWVNGASSSPALTRQGFKYFFRTGPSDLTFAKSFYDFLKSISKQHPVKRVVVIHENDAFGNDGAAAVTQLSSQYGVEVADNIVYQLNSTDLTSQVQKIRAANPDAVFTFAYINDAVLMSKTMAQLGYTPPAILAFGSGWSDPTFIPTMGKLADAAMTRAAWSISYTEKNQAAKVVADYFVRKYGLPMTENSARSFTAMMTLGQAIANARSTDPEKIREALAAIKITRTIMPWPGVKFDSSGQNVEAQGVIAQIQNGKYEVVYPASAATASVIWPMPSLTGR